ncbi:FISUMP domain-containing protein [Elizabethkingia anophelis]|uniref:FISUMP domain-containing protein n=1 Tax=Elizabethkingia anophelis TaxID=1117645 RepID=UPI0032091873
MKILHNKYRAIITSLILVITSLIFILSFLSLSSCRSAEHDNIVTGRGITAVKINLLGSDYKGSSRDISQVQKHTTLVNPSTAIVAELNSTMPTRSISGDQIGSGVQFRVIVYKHNDGSYKTYQDYIIGQPVAPLMLDGGVNYDIVAYSYGVTTLPAISSGEQSNINSATINYDDINRDFMYQKVSYTPDGNNSNNTLNITLRHKLTQITTIINSGSLGSITNVSGILTPHYRNGIFSLNTGLLSGRTNMTSGEHLSYSASEFPGTTVKAMPLLINADTEGNTTGGFSASIEIAGTTKTVSLPNSFKITPEYKSNLTVNIVKCGAYIGPNTDPANFKEFMCQNLGATEGINPFSPEAGNHGAKYQWGYKPINENSSDDRYYTQADDQNNPGKIPGWNRKEVPNGSWSDTSKTENDPCPRGYRVPTKAQWQAVIDNNPNVERVGSWVDSDGNYTSALYFRNRSNNRTLMLPAAGFRDERNGNLYLRGYIGYYSSSSEFSYYCRYLNFLGNDVYVTNYDRTAGFSVRCVAE